MINLLLMRDKLTMILKALNLWGIYAFIYGRWIKARTKKPWVLGRVACLGADTYPMLNTNLPLINIQKGRVDYIWRVNKKVKGAIAKTTKIVPYIKREDIKGLIVQEEFSHLSFPSNPAFIFLDSYAELTDQLFVAKNQNTSFCCNYSDLDPSFNNEFTAEGLLPLKDLSEHYRNFFTLLRERFGNIDIIFIHFPCKLDNRIEFINRHHKIKEVIAEMSHTFQPFYVYEVPDEIVQHAKDDNFPYHYHESTYLYLKEMINKNHFE